MDAPTLSARSMARLVRPRVRELAEARGSKLLKSIARALGVSTTGSKAEIAGAICSAVTTANAPEVWRLLEEG